MKRLTLTMIFVMLGLVGLFSANQPMGVFANYNTNCIQFLDPSTNTTTGPLLAGRLGSTLGGLLDVVITSDGKTAIVGNFGDNKIFFIDISRGFSVAPTLLGHVRLPFPAEDMDITPDDKFVLVTDGSFSNSIAVVDVKRRCLKAVRGVSGKDAQAVAITPDGQTALVADYAGQQVHAYRVRSDGILLFKKTVNVAPALPINLAISPDGRTVIVVCSYRSGAPILVMDSMGNPHFKKITALPSKEGQSCVFSADGTKAYYLTNFQGKGTQVHVLNVTGPGEVTASGTSITVHPMRATGQLFGVDTISLDPAGNYLYVTNPNIGANARAGIAVLDLGLNIQVDCLPAKGLPVGIVFTTVPSGGE